MAASRYAACRHAVKLGFVGPIAQWLEQRTHNPLVPGSSPGGPTRYSFPPSNSFNVLKKG